MKGRMRKNFVGEKNSRSFSEFYLKFLGNMYNLFEILVMNIYPVYDK